MSPGVDDSSDDNVSRIQPPQTYSPEVDRAPSDTGPIRSNRSVECFGGISPVRVQDMSPPQNPIISPTPRLPSSLSTLLNHAETRQEQGSRVSRPDDMGGLFRRSSASPGQQSRAICWRDDQAPREYSPRPVIVPSRHSLPALHYPRPAFPPRNAFRTFPSPRSRSSTPPITALPQPTVRRRSTLTLPHLSETSIGDALQSPRLMQVDRISSGEYLSDQDPVYPQEMHRGVTYPQHAWDRYIPYHQMLWPGSRRNTVLGEDRLVRPADRSLLKASLTLDTKMTPDMARWTESEVALYYRGFDDAMMMVQSGVGRLGEDTFFQVHISNRDPLHPTTVDQDKDLTPRLESCNVPPPQPPHYHQRQQVGQQLRIDPSLQSPDTHTRQSIPNTKASTPTVSTPHRIVHPPPASDYFNAAFPSNSAPASQRAQKRTKRQPISCYPCRDRKLKCDGKTPCGQCSKRHIDGQCHYAKAIRRRGRNRKTDDDGDEADDLSEGNQGGGESSTAAQDRARDTRMNDDYRDGQLEGEADTSVGSGYSVRWGQGDMARILNSPSATRGTSIIERINSSASRG
ncbi:uncharacterized protein IL334_004192 [Kwoniella shivajii]|uniref:Zn(2)-C6 fungal-type domain-containing protein n=1 Tax=Kwoniella shivajii TaxID=564305 RepID=A0ABZ1CZM7_9TREE|nr:hypothetical protein IL334_004192 [Kwoniella shivajii]